MGMRVVEGSGSPVDVVRFSGQPSPLIRRATSLGTISQPNVTPTAERPQVLQSKREPPL